MTDGLGLWALAVFVIGAAMYLVMSLATRSSPTSSRPITARRPGWQDDREDDVQQQPHAPERGDHERDSSGSDRLTGIRPVRRTPRR